MFPGAHAAVAPDKAAVIDATTGEVTTYADLDDEANRLARLFHDAGLRQGDHVAFCLENGPRFLAVCWGAHYAGLIYTAMSTRLTLDEMVYVVDNCNAKAFVGSPAVARLDELVARSERLRLCLSSGGEIPGFDRYEPAVAAVSADPLPDRVAGCDMLYSSGTTGRPKGVLPRHDPLPLSEAGSAVAAMCVVLFDMTPDTVYLSPAPLYHAAPLRFCMAVHVIGATVVVMDHFDAVEYLEAIPRFGVTHSQVVPTMFVRLLQLPAEVRDRADVSSLRCVIHAAAPCPVPVKQQIIDWWGPIVHEYYAGTEGNGFCYCNSEQWLAHPGTVGAPINCEVHIVDDDTGLELPPGAEGTVYFGGGNSFEYHGDPVKTAESRHAKGWSTLGDVGRLDADGYLHLTDRLAHMIISGGVNVYPQEAENVLITHPAVGDVAVIGIPHDDLGEQVIAVVVARSGPRDPDSAARLEAELIDYCRSQLSALKCPRRVDFRDELPRHPTGKLYKRLLRDEYWADHDTRLI